MKCPKCGLINPDSALWCDCGYEFNVAQSETPLPGESAQPTLEGQVVLQKKSVLLMLLFTALTLGFYIPFWFLTRSRALNSLAGKNQIHLAFCVSLFSTIGLSLILGEPSEATLYKLGNVTVTWTMSFSSLVDLTTIILMIFMSWRTRSILGDYLQEEKGQLALLGSTGVRNPISGVGTVFFSIFYLQSQINRLDHPLKIPVWEGVGMAPAWLKGWKIVWLGLTLLFVPLWLLYISAYSATGFRLTGNDAAMAFIVFIVIHSAAISVSYSVHIFLAKHLNTGKKVSWLVLLWLLVFFGMSPVAATVYWYRYVWRNHLAMLETSLPTDSTI